MYSKTIKGVNVIIKLYKNADCGNIVYTINMDNVNFYTITQEDEGIRECILSLHFNKYVLMFKLDIDPIKLYTLIDNAFLSSRTLYLTAKSVEIETKRSKSKKKCDNKMKGGVKWRHF